MKRIDRFRNIALLVAEELVRLALLEPGKTVAINYEPPLAGVVAHDDGQLAVIDSQTGNVWYFDAGKPEQAVEKLLSAWSNVYDTHRNSRSGLEAKMRQESHALGVGGRGGSRPALSEDDGRLNTKPPAIPGILAQNLRLTPFDHERSSTFSHASPHIERCNVCGAWSVGAYMEFVVDADGNTVATYDHEAQPMEHHENCTMKEGVKA